MILTPLKCHTRLYKQIKFGIDILLTYLKEHGEQRIALCLYNILDEEFWLKIDISLSFFKLEFLF